MAATLGGVSDEVIKRVSELEKDLPRGSHMVIRGQVQTMKSSFYRSWLRTGRGHCSGLSANRGKFSVLAGPFHHHYITALPGAFWPASAGCYW